MIDIPNTFYRLSMKALILDETGEKFAIVLQSNGWWELPGGGLDWGESPEACLKREIKEEMGLLVTEVAKYPSYLLVGKNLKDNWSANVIYETKVQDLNLIPSDECQELRFVSPHEIKSLNAFRTVIELGEQFDPARHMNKL